MNESIEQMEANSVTEMLAAGVPTEEQLREQDSPHPKTPEELTAFIAALVDRPHSYGTCVYAMSLSAVAAFNYVAHKLGVTGFQASCADMDILRHTRGFKFGWLLNFDDLLYPQYKDKLPTWDGLLIEHRAKLAEMAKAKLAETNGRAHPDVLSHWKSLAANG